MIDARSNILEDACSGTVRPASGEEDHASKDATTTSSPWSSAMGLRRRKDQVMREERSVSGIEYLVLVTELLDAARLVDPLHGTWEAADLQWWWRRDQHRDPGTQTFLMDGERPVSAVVLTNWGGRWQLDLLFTSPQHAEELKQLWPRAVQMMASVEAAPIELEVPTSDEQLIGCAVDAGFDIESKENWTCWMPASERPVLPRLASGFTLQSRTEAPDRPHPMAERSGTLVEARLAECSLYDPDLDLAVYTSEGDVAGYSLYWADHVTGVGLVEPMRTEDAFQHKGIARYMLAVGLDRLARSGCERLKVSTDIRLYLSAGFTRTSSSLGLSKRMQEEL
jgi:GNAT superfamily N-acetyltransferase